MGWEWEDEELSGDMRVVVLRFDREFEDCGH